MATAESKVRPTSPQAQGSTVEIDKTARKSEEPRRRTKKER
jgi:hypothetical protein